MVRSGINNIGDHPHYTDEIGAVTTLVPVYPADDASHTCHQVSQTSRDIVDAFCERHTSTEPTDRYACCLARRLCRPEGGITAQNLVLLSGLIKSLQGEELSDIETEEYHRLIAPAKVEALA